MNERLMKAVQHAAATNGCPLTDQAARAVVDAAVSYMDGEVRVVRLFPQEMWSRLDFQDHVRKAELSGLYWEAVKQHLVPVGLPVEEVVYRDTRFTDDGRRLPGIPYDTPARPVDPWWQVEVTWSVPTRQTRDLNAPSLT